MIKNILHTRTVPYTIFSAPFAEISANFLESQCSQVHTKAIKKTVKNLAMSFFDKQKPAFLSYIQRLTDKIEKVVNRKYTIKT